MVNGKKYSTDELDQLPPQLSPDKIAIRENSETVLFYRSDAYLSNFHKAPFSINNIKYECVEQYFTAEKARCFNDRMTLNKIMKADTPQEMKYWGNNTKGFVPATWNEKASTVMINGLRAKFQQNENLSNKLVNTGERQIAEISRNDRTWGIGLGMTDPNAFNKQKWVGKNQLGNLLIKVREEIAKSRA